MRTLDEIKQTLIQSKEGLKQRFEVKEIGIFGSWLSGKHTENSDVDILVEFQKPIGFFKFLELEEHLEKILGTKVDLVSKKALKPRIGQHILREVILL